MKKNICTFFLFFCVISSSFAQTQQGIVKTRGRMVDGQVVPGVCLDGVMVTLNYGNPLVSGNDGEFSFNVPSGKNYSLVAAHKQGYTLADADFTKRSFSFTADNPFYVVMEDENQRQASINAAMLKVRKKMKEELRKREDELDSLLFLNAIGQAKYDSLKAEFYNYRQSSEELVREMAERYAATDYDQLDEYTSMVQMYIENGELVKADSLIRSKGDIKQRIAAYYNIVATNKAERNALNQREENLSQSEKLAEKTYEELSLTLYQRHEIFKQQFQQDSALFYLKMRADLDLTNINAVLDYANLCSKQKKYSDCKKYYMICRDEYSRIDNDLGVADINCRLGYFYNEINDYVQSHLLFSMALKAYELLSEDTPDAYIDRIALTHAGMALNASNRNDYQESEKHRMLALKYNEQLFKKNPDSYRANLMFSQLETGALYMDTGKLVDSERYYNLALQNCEILYGQAPEVYRDAIAGIKASLGALYSQVGDYTKGEQYSISALETYRQLAQQNPDAYLGMKANIEGSLGALYASREDYATCEKYYKQALSDYKIAVSGNPEFYLGEMANVESGLGLNYGYLRDFTGAEKYLKLAYEHYELLFQQKPKVYRGGLANACSNLGLLYLYLNDLTSSEKYYHSASVHYEQLFKQNPDAFRASLAITQKQLGSIYGHLNDYSTSIQYYKQAIVHYEQMFSANPDAYRKDLAKVQSDLGILYGFAFQDRNNGAKYFMSAIKNYEQLYKQNPTLFVAEYGNTLNNLANMYVGLKKFNESLKAIDKAIALMPDNAGYYDTKGEIFLMQGNNQEALRMWKKVLELSPNFLKDYPNGTGLSNGLKELGLIK